ncbi:MAG: GNAT family N-acetyltransferase [Tabrizicola sp.]|nr:GNAT family N-acetyltransferase [Tabrizicola sp.]
MAGFLLAQDPARERGWIAARGPLRLGSIFCLQDPGPEPDVAKLRLFLVERSERGTGLAHRMLETCLSFARTAGYRKMRLWTHESHRAAGRLYARNGFAVTEARAARSFRQDVVVQIWERSL